MLNIDVVESNTNLIDNNYLFKFLLKLIYPCSEKFNMNFFIKNFYIKKIKNKLLVSSLFNYNMFSNENFGNIHLNKYRYGFNFLKTKIKK